MWQNPFSTKPWSEKDCCYRGRNSYQQASRQQVVPGHPTAFCQSSIQGLAGVFIALVADTALNLDEQLCTGE